MMQVAIRCIKIQSVSEAASVNIGTTLNLIQKAAPTNPPTPAPPPAVPAPPPGVPAPPAGPGPKGDGGKGGGPAGSPSSPAATGD